MQGKRLGLRLLTAASLIMGALVGMTAAPVQHVAAESTAAIAPQPEVTTSYYVYAASLDSAVQDEFFTDGNDQGQEDCNTPGEVLPGGSTPVTISSVYLDFGAQDLTGAGTWSTVGTIGAPTTPYYTNAQIEQAVLSFIEGYDYVSASCIDNDNHDIITSLYIGTSNDGQTPTDTEANEQADAWYGVSKTTWISEKSWVNTNGIDGGYAAEDGPASDIEPGFSEPPTATVIWAGELASDQAGDNYIVIDASDYGSADGCPTSGDTGSSTCNNGWTIGDLGEVATDLDYDMSPQIYVSAQAEQWADFYCGYYDPANGSLPIGTVLADPAGPGYLSTAGAWTNMMDDLATYGDTDCESYAQSAAYGSETTFETGNAIQ